MPFNLLLFPLLAGYIFIHSNHYLRLKAQTLDGNRLLFESSKYGLLFLGFARLLTLLAARIPYLSGIDPALESLLPQQSEHYFGTALIALGIGVIAGPISNLGRDEVEASAEALKNHGSLMVQLLNDAADNGDLVSITLDTRKWYVGYVTQTPTLSPDDQYLSIIPVFSGYRDRDTLEAKRLTTYRYTAGVDEEFYAKVVPVGHIVDANLFDRKLFESYYEHHATD